MRMQRRPAKRCMSLSRRPGTEEWADEELTGSPTDGMATLTHGIPWAVLPCSASFPEGRS